MNPHFEPGLKPDLRALPPPLEVEDSTRTVRVGWIVAAALTVLFVALTWFVAGPLQGARIDQVLNQRHEIRDYAPVLHVMDRIGQRAVCLPVLAIVAAILSWRHRSLRPVLVSVAAVVAINLVVLVLKLSLGRGDPLDHRPAFFINGTMYPSGHASNIVVVYGIAVYLISRYGSVSRRVRGVLAATVGLLAVVMTVTSVLLRWHWLSDLLAGYLVGGVVLAIAVALDRATPLETTELTSPVTRPSAQ